ncbi:MAG: MFS transporter [Actinomycetota bacterium]|nr:MFS transporter [Actinomycetota bacterium]
MRKNNNKSWLTKSIFGIGLTSLFSDMGHEMATAILPMFIVTIGGTAATLGLIEGVADASSSFVKLWMGYCSDRIKKRKPIAVIGYVITALKGLFAFTTSWPQVLAIRAAAWMGRGARGPVRDAMMADMLEPANYGRAFGFHTAMDTLGAVLGPAIALALVGVLSYRQIFLISFIPGLASVGCFAFLVKEKKRKPDGQAGFWKNIKELPLNFKLFVFSAGIFGLGNFAHTLLILRATEILTPQYGKAAAVSMAVGLYTLHNVLYAGFAYPAGILSEKVGKRTLLGAGYLLFALMCLGFILEPPKLWAMAILFILAGVYIALVDSMERALAGELLPEHLRGTGYGFLATVNGIGDFVSSFVVGLLWSRISPAAGFVYSGILTFIGAVLLFMVRNRK